MPPRKATGRRRLPVRYSEAAALVEPLAALIRQREAAHRDACRDADAARAVCSTAYAEVVEAVTYLRDLTVVLTDGACTSGKPPDIGDTLDAVHALLEDSAR